MSRGTETIETVSLTLSSDATIIVSVRYVFRPTPASTPTRSTFTRGTAGVGEGLGLTVALGDADAGTRSLDRARRSAADPPVADGDGSKISSAVSRATSVAYPA